MFTKNGLERPTENIAKMFFKLNDDVLITTELLSLEKKTKLFASVKGSNGTFSSDYYVDNDDPSFDEICKF